MDDGAQPRKSAEFALPVLPAGSNIAEDVSEAKYCVLIYLAAFCANTSEHNHFRRIFLGRDSLVRWLRPSHKQIYGIRGRATTKVGGCEKKIR
jgi:hypothetical protein